MSVAFTTGCQMAHFTGLASARDHVLRAAGWGVLVVAASRLNQGLVRFLDLRPGATEADHDAGGVSWGGKRAMRVCVVNWRTDDAAVSRTIVAVGAALQRPNAKRPVPTRPAEGST